MVACNASEMCTSGTNIIDLPSSKTNIIDLFGSKTNIIDLFGSKTNIIDLFSSTERNFIELINYVILSGAIAFLGLLTNMVNIIVFYKQGFGSTVNISLFALAISDICNLVFVTCFSIGMNPLFIYSDINIWPAEILYLTSGMPHICFARITGWITVFITAERCLCIAVPLKIKEIVTPTRTTFIIVSIYTVIILTFVPEYATSYHCWKFYDIRNRTLLGLCFTEDHNKVGGLVFFVYSTLGSISFVAVVIFTGILVVQLHRKSKWRVQATNDQDRRKTDLRREKKTITMVVMISTVLIVCYTPGVIVSMVAFFVSEFGIFGAYVNTYYIMWSFGFVLETLNSSINILFYYKMSAKYKDTVHMIFADCIQTHNYLHSNTKKGQPEIMYKL